MRFNYQETLQLYADIERNFPGSSFMKVAVYRDELDDAVQLAKQHFPNAKVHGIVTHWNLPENVSVVFIDFETKNNETYIQ
jgi:hypothetical protein